MDDVDRTQANEPIIQLANIQQSLRYIPPTEVTGYCLFCNEPVSKPRRWCNAQCRDDWELTNA